MEFFLKVWMGIGSFMEAILNSAWLTFVTSALLFFASIFGFAYFYLFLHSVHKENLTRIDNMSFKNVTMPVFAFEISDSLKRKYETIAKNELLIKPSIDGFSNHSWAQYTFVFKKMHEQMLLNLKNAGEGTVPSPTKVATLGRSASSLVEDVFPKYPNVLYRIESYLDNNLEKKFPALVLSHYLDSENFNNIAKKIEEKNLTEEEQKIVAEIMRIIPGIRGNILENPGNHNLEDLTRFLRKYSREIENKSLRPQQIREAFYSEILAIIATNTDIKFDFGNFLLSLSFPDFWDLLQISATIGTSNTTSDLIPITNDARFAMWTQLIFSYFILALNVAALTKLVRLS